MKGFEENEISVNANGGTEITKRLLASNIDESLLQEFQIIPSRVRDLKNDKIRIYWIHDLAEDGEVKQLRNNIDKFHKVVFVSNWQQYDICTKLKIPYTNKLRVIENGITPITKHDKSKGTLNLIYMSTPQRGLELLLPVFDELSKKYDIHLHIFSSFKIYGWEDADKQFEPLFTFAKNHPKITYYGTVSQDELREKLRDMHILAYPNIWPETSCRVLMECMSAGVLCVHPNLAALPETSGGLTTMYPFLEDKRQHMQLFSEYLEYTIKNYDHLSRIAPFIKFMSDTRFNLELITEKWTVMLKDLLEEYNGKDISIPTDYFTINTG